MKAVILAGGKGTRIQEESHLRPKPMIEIGGKPILWHIMKTYSYHGINDFIICLGYRGYMIKEYFSNYALHQSDITIDVMKNNVHFHGHDQSPDPWQVTLVDTGEETETGGRLKRVSKYLQGEESFCMTYGDGVADVNISDSIQFHQQHGCLATLTAVQPPGRFGALVSEGNRITSFIEKPQGQGGYINGGYFVLSSKVLDYIEQDDVVWEGAPMGRLAVEQQLMAYYHDGFWQPMDTLRDKNYLESQWATGAAPWKKWQN